MTFCFDVYRIAEEKITGRFTSVDSVCEASKRRSPYSLFILQPADFSQSQGLNRKEEVADLITIMIAYFA